MRKARAKAKTKALKKKSSPKTRRKLEIDSTLKARLEAEFAQAVRSAKTYADDPLRLLLAEVEPARPSQELLEPGIIEAERRRPPCPARPRLAAPVHAVYPAPATGPKV